MHINALGAYTGCLEIQSKIDTVVLEYENKLKMLNICLNLNSFGIIR